MFVSLYVMVFPISTSPFMCSIGLTAKAITFIYGEEGISLYENPSTVPIYSLASSKCKRSSGILPANTDTDIINKIVIMPNKHIILFNSLILLLSSDFLY